MSPANEQQPELRQPVGVIKVCIISCSGSAFCVAWAPAGTWKDCLACSSPLGVSHLVGDTKDTHKNNYAAAQTLFVFLKHCHSDRPIMLRNKSRRPLFPRDTRKSIKSYYFQSGERKNNWYLSLKGMNKGCSRNYHGFLVSFQTLSKQTPFGGVFFIW